MISKNINVAANHKQHQQQFSWGDLMRLSIMAGWVYSVLRVVGEGKRGAGGCANRDVIPDPDCAKSDLQTLAPSCRSSQKSVKMPVDIGVLISLRANWFSPASQNLSRLVARMIVARKGQRAFRGEGGVVENEPGIRCASSGLRLLSQSMSRWMFLFAGCFSITANAQVPNPAPTNCKQYGGTSVCTPVLDTFFYSGVGQWQYPNQPPPPPLWVLGKSGVEVASKFTTEQNRLSREQSYWSNANYGYSLLWLELEYVAGSCEKSLPYITTPPPVFIEGINLTSYWYGAHATCAYDTYNTTPTTRVFSYHGGGSSVGAAALCPSGTLLDGFRYTAANAPPGITPLYQGVNSEWVCVTPDEPKPECKEKTCVGNPISVSRARKTQIETIADLPQTLTDFARLTYSYPSRSANRTFGENWQPQYFRKLYPIDAGQPYVTKPLVYVVQGADVITFYNTAGIWAPDADMDDRLTEVKNASNVRTGWRYYNAVNDSNEQFDLAGNLITITARSGQVTTLAYNTDNQLQTVTDSFGRVLTYAYFPANTTTLAKGNVSSLTYDGKVTTFEYDSNRNLTRIVRADGRDRKFLYNEQVNTANALLLGALTGIIDENGIRYATFKYNSQGQAVETKHQVGVDDVNKFSLSFYPGNGVSIVTDPLGTQRTYNFTNVLSVPKLSSLTQPCTTPGCTGNVTQSSTYDTNGNITSRTDFNNNKMCYTYDLTRNLETGRIEGLTSSADCAASFAAATLTAPARKITTTWHPTYRLPATITEPITGGSKTTTNSYDANGNLTQRVVTTPQATRTWLWSGYDAYGRATTMTDPRGKITTYAYYPNTAAQNVTLANSRGMLASIANAVGHANTITAYNAHGQPLSMTDANGLTTTMTFDARMRLKSRTVSGTGINETTNYDYDGVGQLIKVTLPDSSFITYTYDGAHRLIQIQDGGVANTGNKIVYTLDAMGNRTGEQAFDPAGLLARSRTRVYDALNRLKQDIGATTPATQISQYGYDNQGNGTTTTDPLSRVTTNAFDALNRLVQVTDPNTPTAGITKYDYDVQDNLTKVVDPKFSPQGASAPATTYTYNGFNELISQTSPDTGLTTYTYDAAGNMLTKTDARDKVAKYVYDNLNRVTQIRYYPTSANANANTSADETVTYTYDSCTNGKGRLCTLSDKSGTTTYSYDLLGRTTAKSQAVASLTQSHNMRYNSAGQMDQLTTASGQVIGYGYSNNRVTSISVNGTALIGSITYDPFGPPVAWLWPSATTPLLKTYRDYDLDGRMIRWELKNGVSYIQRDVVWDNASRVTNLKDLLTPTQANNQGFGYDALDRLTTTTLGTATTPSQTLAYDAIGNRTSATINGIIATYNLPTNSHKLTSTVGGTNPRAFTYDAMGNLSFDGKYTNTYLNNGRLRTVVWTVSTTTNTVTYDINALGQRVRKAAPGSVGGTRRFMYDEAGRLAGEYDSAGKLVQETIWLGDLPVATLRPKSGSTTTPIAIDVFYVHADHLGTPRVITRPSDNKIVWKWDSTEAFGNNLPNENPSALGAFKYNLRMPGQYFDQETGTFYNYFRDYDPSLGRYVQSDPIGLKGGINTFAYAGAQPLVNTDPFGLFVPLIPPGIALAEAIITIGGGGYILYQGHQSMKNMRAANDEKYCQQPDDPCAGMRRALDKLYEQITQRSNVMMNAMKVGVFPTRGQNLDLKQSQDAFNAYADLFNRECVPRGWAPERRRFDTGPMLIPNPDRLREFYEK